MPGMTQGADCNQTSFKIDKGSFFFIGPGPKGIGYKAMFKLDKSMDQAKKLSKEKPDQFQIGATGWVTTRFTAENPLPKNVWEKWLKESYELTKSKAAKETNKTKKGEKKT